MKKLIYVVLLLLYASFAFAEEKETKFPYFASIKAKTDVANVRNGPSVKYPIQWVYQKPNWPVEVEAAFENWRKIKDIYGEAGWIHETLLSRKRHAVIKGDGVEQAYKLPMENAVVAMVLEENVVVELLSCKSGWCKIMAEDHKGWINATRLWGVNFDEEFN